jgi:hypothetical protein
MNMQYAGRKIVSDQIFIRDVSGFKPHFIALYQDSGHSLSFPSNNYIIVFSIRTRFRLICGYQHFGGVCGLHLQD